jgi:hypothetical protein
MPAWREYWVVELYLNLDCTVWVKTTERSANDVCFYCNRAVTVPVKDLALCGTQCCCRYCAIISGTVTYGLPWAIARSIIRQLLSDPHLLRLLCIPTLCQCITRRETNNLICKIYFPNANMPVFFSAFVPHLVTQSLESNKFESECKYLNRVSNSCTGSSILAWYHL